ncbi:hypothetical protein RCMCDREAMY_87 [Rhodobacter phage RcMcDreamy]|nr:hypothetical protein RCMCDREAMY_87 [Rhodobacter phage RcMcDreamy]UUV43057.1 hypothetical protein RCAQUAPHINA_87 [Rhodobacter phage RcAquaphina]
MRMKFIKIIPGYHAVWLFIGPGNQRRIGTIWKTGKVWHYDGEFQGDVMVGGVRNFETMMQAKQFVRNAHGVLK